MRRLVIGDQPRERQHVGVGVDRLMSVSDTTRHLRETIRTQIDGHGSPVPILLCVQGRWLDHSTQPFAPGGVPGDRVEPPE